VIDLTTVLGNELIVSSDPHQVDRQHTGFAGADGLTSMHLGTRGRAIIVTGTIRVAAPNYVTGRSNAENAIDALMALQFNAEIDYSFAGSYYYAVIFEKLVILTTPSGKSFIRNSAGQMIVRFVYHLRSLL
jgi:hypothetical protein